MYVGSHRTVLQLMEQVLGGLIVCRIERINGGGENIPTLVNLQINELHEIYVGAHELLNICSPVIRRVCLAID